MKKINLVLMGLLFSINALAQNWVVMDSSILSNPSHFLGRIDMSTEEKGILYGHFTRSGATSSGFGNWQSFNGIPEGDFVDRLTVLENGQYIATTYSNTPSIIKSSDGGLNWQVLSTFSNVQFVGGVSQHFTVEGYVYYLISMKDLNTFEYRIYKSSNLIDWSPDAFEPLFGSQSLSYVLGSSDGKIHIGNYNSTINRWINYDIATEVFDTIFSSQNEPFNYFDGAKYDFKDDLIIAYSYNQYVYKSENGGETWQILTGLPNIPEIDGMFQFSQQGHVNSSIVVSVKIFSDNHYLISGNYRLAPNPEWRNIIIQTYDGGNTWDVTTAAIEKSYHDDSNLRSMCFKDGIAYATTRTENVNGYGIEYRWKNTSVLANVNENDFQEIELYPNPSLEIINVVGFEVDMEYSIFNNLGEEVQNGFVTNEIPISKLKPGSYFVRFGNGTSKKIVKK